MQLLSLQQNVLKYCDIISKVYQQCVVIMGLPQSDLNTAPQSWKWSKGAERLFFFLIGETFESHFFRLDDQNVTFK